MSKVYFICQLFMRFDEIRREGKRIVLSLWSQMFFKRFGYDNQLIEWIIFIICVDCASTVVYQGRTEIKKSNSVYTILYRNCLLRTNFRLFNFY